MNSDEKNRFSSNTNEFDPDFRRKDKYDTAKDDKQFMKGHKRTNEDPKDVNFSGKGIHHDPHNEHLKDPNRLNKKYNQSLESDGFDFNREESPTNRDLHHKYIPDAKCKPHKDKPQKVAHHKYVDLPGDQKKEIKREQKDTEIIHSTATQFQGKTHYAQHGRYKKT